MLTLSRSVFVLATLCIPPVLLAQVQPQLPDDLKLHLKDDLQKGMRYTKVFRLEPGYVIATKQDEEMFEKDVVSCLGTGTLLHPTIFAHCDIAPDVTVEMQNQYKAEVLASINKMPEQLRETLIKEALPKIEEDIRKDLLKQPAAGSFVMAQPRWSLNLVCAGIGAIIGGGMGTGILLLSGRLVPIRRKNWYFGRKRFMRLADA